MFMLFPISVAGGTMEKDKPWTVRLEKHMQNLNGHLEISRLAQHSFEESLHSLEGG